MVSASQCLPVPAPEVAPGARYFPPPDSEGGWRKLESPSEVRRVAGLEKTILDDTFDLIQKNTPNGGLLVVRRGWLAYERYFGLGHREATPNLASCGKSFTSIAIGILIDERPDLFPDGLRQRVFTPRHFPPKAFPQPDPRREDILLGQLLSFTAGIRGTSPGYVRGEPVPLHPSGPESWHAFIDDTALGLEDCVHTHTIHSTRTSWCDPGAGYSYSTASTHLASIMLRHVTGMELETYLDQRLAKPLGWGRWGFGYEFAREKFEHTPGGGGITLRSTDMLRFGYLLLREGRWHDRQIVPAEYVRHSSRKSPFNPHYPYSLQFFVNTDGEIPGLPRDAFWTSGSGGHVLYVIPSLDLVVWKLGGRDRQYAESDTGFAPHPEAPTAPPHDWTPTIDDEAALRRTLELVVAAVRD